MDMNSSVPPANYVCDVKESLIGPVSLSIT